jgi:flagellar biosynthesis anti-sigma factor FlgM
MSNKINIDKASGFSPVRATGQSEVKKSGGDLAKPIETSKTGNEDKVEFSNRGTEVGKLVDQVRDLPDGRDEEKISQLREQISSGNYNPSSDAIADAILNDKKI